MILGVAPQSGTFDINTVPKFLLSGDWNMTINKEIHLILWQILLQFQY